MKPTPHNLAPGGQEADSKEFVTRDMCLSRSEELARAILGEDFLSLSEVEKAHNFCFTKNQRAALIETVPDFETLWWLWDEGCVLVATQSSDYNLLQLRAQDNPIMIHKSDKWLARKHQTFVCKDVVQACRWLAVRKEPYLGSMNRAFPEQQQLLSAVEYIPNAAEVTYTITSYCKVRGLRLLKDVSVRTSSVDMSNQSVIVGNHTDDGLSIGQFWDSKSETHIGISSARGLDWLML